MFFKFLVWFGKLFNIDGAPICRVWSDDKTESYTLYNNGWIIIASPKDESTDMLHICQVSEVLIAKFEAKLA